MKSRLVDGTGIIATVAGQWSATPKPSTRPRSSTPAAPRRRGEECAGIHYSAQKVRLKQPTDVCPGPDHGVYIADSSNHAIRFLQNGRIHTVAGWNGPGFDGDGGLGTSARLQAPTAVVVLPEGLLIADRENHALRLLDDHGVITTWAGGNGAGHSADGLHRLESSFHRPRALALGPDGAVFVSDRDNHAIRRIDREGRVTTVAGGNGGGYAGDGGPAVLARLARPRGLRVDGEGNLYVVDRNNHAVRRIDRNGIISTWAGGNGPGYSGDGGDAREGRFNYPSAIVFDRDGTAFVADHFNHCIRVVTSDGQLTTVAGGNGPGYAGDGGDAIMSQIWYPSGLALTSHGELYVADRKNGLVRVIRPAG